MYRKSDDFLFHLGNYPIEKYVECVALAINFSIEISSNVSNDAIEKMNVLDFHLSMSLKHLLSTLDWSVFHYNLGELVDLKKRSVFSTSFGYGVGAFCRSA